MAATLRVRVTLDGEQFVIPGIGIITSDPGDLILELTNDKGTTFQLLEPEVARQLGLNLMAEGRKGLVKKYGQAEALKRMLRGQSLKADTNGGESRG